jgi:hypothetical protein
MLLYIDTKNLLSQIYINFQHMGIIIKNFGFIPIIVLFYSYNKTTKMVNVNSVNVNSVST